MTTPESCAGTFAPPTMVDTTPATPYRFGAMSAFTILDSPDVHEQNGIYYKSPACAGVNTFVDDCNSGDVDPKTPTDVDRDAVVSGCPFHLYAYLSCRTSTLEQMREDAVVALNLGEQRGVEQNVWAQVLNTADSVIVNTVPGAAGALGIVAALAALESRMADCYGGQATVHANRGIANYAAAERQLEKQGAAAFTPLGSRWAFYAGNDDSLGPDGSVTPAGHTWVYATSQLTLRRWGVGVPGDVDHTLVITADGAVTNEPIVIAERTYVPSVECCAFAVLVCLGSCS